MKKIRNKSISFKYFRHVVKDILSPISVTYNMEHYKKLSVRKFQSYSFYVSLNQVFSKIGMRMYVKRYLF